MAYREPYYNCEIKIVPWRNWSGVMSREEPMPFDPFGWDSHTFAKPMRTCDPHRGAIIIRCFIENIGDVEFMAVCMALHYKFDGGDIEQTVVDIHWDEPQRDEFVEQRTCNYSIRFRGYVKVHEDVFGDLRQSLMGLPPASPYVRLDNAFKRMAAGW